MSNTKKLDLLGKSFGMWNVICFDGMKNGKSYWMCTCKCGVKRSVCGSHLINSQSSGCGCKRHLELSERNKTTKTKHGLRKTRFYGIWSGIHHRINPCYDGVIVCDRWNIFENFRDDMYASYLDHQIKFGQKNTTIDRINPYGNYQPDNCRWATWKEQNTNKRKNVKK